ncbi:hypothetical protein AcW1_009816 [Taiwanofungus camphoratus]|nr:hypothetical protein AcV5_003344 [Antrodia cinnamomea]KAI0946336.1 hypothetical protein AcW1_009816 [Antrodia cinnamomea]
MTSPWPSLDRSGDPRSGATTPDDASAFASTSVSQPRTPYTSTFEDPLLSNDSRDASPKAPSHSLQPHFVSSPLNPNTSPSHTFRPRPFKGSTYINRVASEEAQALASQPFFPDGAHRGSMVLYRLASDDASDFLAPPKPPDHRNSVMSSSGDSVFTITSDSKYPSGAVVTGQRGFVPYAYDPALDMKDEPDEDDHLHRSELADQKHYWSWRGIINVGMLVIVLCAILTLFIGYPVIHFYHTNTRDLLIENNINVNATGQVEIRFEEPQMIDPDTPDSVKQRIGFDNQTYELVFSDEFNTDGRTFYPGDDPFWEAVDLWYGATDDQEWYDPAQVSTQDGHLRIIMEQVADPSSNHNLPYKSGMLQSWNKFCFTRGYIEVSITLPGPDSNTQGYWPGAWTMGNLARPGYAATTDGTWPYSYDSCDVGTFPNQTYANGTGPPAALYSDASKDKYNDELSWLRGQRLSSCTCPGEDHPGPTNSKGRGAPEIDILEAQKNKMGDGQVVSQSAQFAPFAHDYELVSDPQDAWRIRNTSITQTNPYRGSAMQQAGSALTNLPDNMFQGSGQQFTTLGFEYWSNTSSSEEGFITWQVGGQPTVTMSAAAVGPDQGDGGSMVSQRLISEEPMSISFNLAISTAWQDIDLSTLTFPAEMRVDYVRVYQRSGQKNVGCNPPDYPTADYINAHMEPYTNPNLTSWSQPGPSSAGYTWPKNGLYAGGC